MTPEEALTIMKLTQSLATLSHAAAFLAVCEDRGLTPFLEIYPIFAEKKEKVGGEWKVTGLKGMTFKEHYSVQNRWSQKSGGYSTPFRKTENVTRTNEYGKQETGVEVTVGIITNRDYAALAMMAQARIPGWDYATEREAFIHYATAFCADSHRPPSGWTIQGVARKRAEEQALKLAFGKEPSQSRQMYSNIIAADNDAIAALYGEPRKQEALPAPPVIEAELVTAPASSTPPEPEPFFDEAADARLIAQQVADAEDEAAAAQSKSKTPLLDEKPQGAADLSAFDATPFASPTAATAWAVSLGAFGKPDGGTGKRARAAWDNATAGAQNDSERAQMWRADVARRLDAQA